MIMRLIAGAFCASALLAVPAMADPIEDCKGLEDVGAVVDCLQQEYEIAGRQLVTATGALEQALGRIDGKARPRIGAVGKFRAAHDRWADYRDRECAFLGALQDWGENAERDVLECLIVETDRRAQRYVRLADGMTERYLD
jgi:uncharacterized protein YecT (DUF1311 family)